MEQINIVGPGCVFINHVRWLILLDNKFSIPTPIVTLTKLEHKINFIFDKVYHTSRTWHNWLPIEYKYRFLIDKNSPVQCVETPDTNKILPTDKIIVCKNDPKIAWRLYLKFCHNSAFNLGVSDYNQYKSRLNRQFKKHDDFLQKHESLLTLDNSILWQNHLDKKFYQKIVDFLQLENNYESANSIHKAWYQLHRSSEKQFLSYLNEIFV